MSRTTTPTYVLLNQITLAATSSTVTFSNIPQNYGDLVLVTSATYSGASQGFFYLDFNLDTNNSNYSRVDMYGNGSGFSSAAFANLIPMTLSSVQSLNITQVMEYSATDKHKTILTRNNTNTDTFALAGRWANTAATTSLRFRAYGAYSFAIGSTFSLYGLVA